MALLKHRGITRASYDALIAPDPNTEYTVLETDGTFTRYIGSKAIKDKTAARLDNDGNLNLGGKNITNVNELTVAELTSLVESIIVKKTLELQADINFDGHKAIHPNIEDGVLENALDANSQEILNPVLRGAKRIGESPTEDDDLIDLKTAYMLLSKIGGLKPDGTDVLVDLSSTTPQTFFYGNPMSAHPLSKSSVAWVKIYSTYSGPGSELIIGTYNKQWSEAITPANGYPENCKLLFITYAGYLYVYGFDTDVGLYQEFQFIKKLSIHYQIYGWGGGSGSNLGVDYGVVNIINGGVQIEID